MQRTIDTIIRTIFMYKAAGKELESYLHTLTQEERDALKQFTQAASTYVERSKQQCYLIF